MSIFWEWSSTYLKDPNKRWGQSDRISGPAWDSRQETGPAGEVSTWAEEKAVSVSERKAGWLSSPDQA
jgi:hypothetical protein